MVGRVDQSGVDIIVPGTPGRLKRNRHRSLVSYKEDREGNSVCKVAMISSVQMLHLIFAYSAFTSMT